MVVGQNMIYRQTNGIGSQINNCVFDYSHLLTEKYMRCLFLLFLFYQIYVKSKRKFVSNLCEIVVIGKEFFAIIPMAGSGFGYQVDLFCFIYYNNIIISTLCLCTVRRPQFTGAHCMSMFEKICIKTFRHRISEGKNRKMRCYFVLAWETVLAARTDPLV